MSTSGIKLMCNQPSIEVDPEGITPPTYFVTYRAAPILNGFDSGGVRIVIDGLTETELNAQVQQAIVDQANEALPGQNFVLGDVLGGRS